MTTIYFFYGLAFFTLGVSLFVREAPKRIIDLQAGLRWLALFALIHSANEWLVMAKLAGLIGAEDYADNLIALAGGASFIALLTAGLLLTVSHATWDKRTAKLIAIAAATIWLVVLLPSVEGQWHFVRSDITMRWLIGAPGAILAGIGLIIQSRALIRTEREK